MFIFPQMAQRTQTNAASCIITQRISSGLFELLGIIWWLFEYSCVFILPQMAQITQRNTAWLHYFAEKFVWIIGVIGDICVNLLETLGVIWWLIEYSYVDILPQIAQITQRNTAKLYYFAEKDKLFEVKAVLSFWVLSAIICEICGRHWGFVCANCLSTLMCLFSRRWRRLRRRMQQSCIISQRKTGWDGLCSFVVFWDRKSVV